jgi:membrane-associated phospholipid phosphatase
MRSPTDTASKLSGRLRRFFLFYIASLIGSLQVIFALVEYGKFDFEPSMMVWIIPAILPITLGALWAFNEEPRASAHEPAQWIGWGVGAAAMFGVWAGLYFLVGRYTDPSRVRYLPAYFESTIPFRPNYTLLYVLLYPIFLLPFFAVRDRQAYLRVVTAYLLMFGICTVTFLAIPVAFDRPPLPAGPHDFGVWVLGLVRGTDPPWNCLPSEHCAAAMVAALATWEADRKLGLFAFFTAFLIGISTLYTKQHYLVDVLCGYGLAASIHFGLRWSHRLESDLGLGGVLDRLDRLLNR